jgi:hypothetical protein
VHDRGGRLPDSGHVLKVETGSYPGSNDFWRKLNLDKTVLIYECCLYKEYILIPSTKIWHLACCDMNLR